MPNLLVRLKPLAVAWLVLLAACVTVNIYFPAAKVERTADEIVDEVYKDKDKPKPKPQSLAPEALSASRLAGLKVSRYLVVPQAQAADATTVSNSAIRALKDQITRQHQALAPQYDAGRVGIDRNGYLVVRDAGGLNLKQVADLKRLVEADNAARRQLYQEVARALNLPGSEAAKVQGIFAEKWREKANGGWWIQADDGQWRRK